MAGVLATETLRFDSVGGGEEQLQQAVFGCERSLVGFSYVDGLLGMGRTALSLPNQVAGAEAHSLTITFTLP